MLLVVPMLAALAVVLLSGNRRWSKYVAIVGSVSGLLLLYFISYGTTTLPWFTIGNFTFNITMTIEQFNLALLFVVLFIGSLIMVYSSAFMELLSEQRRYYAEMLAFEISMVVFAMSGNFILLFIAWEFLSLLSYLLIGFWHVRDRTNRAARLAVTTVFIGDIALIAAIVIFWSYFGSLEFSTILASVPAVIPIRLYAGVLLLLLAIFTKSAQFPFQEWLPEAMEGPTPVSAFLHSSTMVKAGVFAAIILFPLLYGANVLPVILAVGIITAVISTLNAMKETQIKKVLAYSTVQELALMLIAVSVGAIFAAIYFFVIQSFYKALLFFSSGSIMRSTSEEHLGNVSGLRSNKLLFASTLIGVLSVAGFFPLSGFFAAASLDTTIFGNMLVYVIISLVGFGTSFYIFRWFFNVSKRPAGVGVEIRYSGESRRIVYPAALLALSTVAASVIFLGIERFLSQGAASAPYLSNSLPLGIGLYDAIIFTVLIIAGAVISYLVYASRYSKRLLRVGMGPLKSLVYSHMVFMAVYNLLAKFVYYIGDGIGFFDDSLNTALDYLGHTVIAIASRFRRISVGAINPYAFIFIIGLIFLLAYAYMVV